MKITILGAGLAGISASYHIGHANCIVFEKNNYLGGHIHTEIKNGFTWDEGPHVSFTKHEYVKQLFAENVKHTYEEYPVTTANYYKGTWIPHPAQSNLYAVPQPLREKCLKDFLESRKGIPEISTTNYEDWLKAAFGETFYNEFPRAYTEKYWTLAPCDLSTDWVGERVFLPNVEEVQAGYLKPLDKQTHYITKVRYPKEGGYFSYVNGMKDGINVQLNKALTYISFEEKYLQFDNQDKKEYYDQLISTIPLTELIDKSDAPQEVKEAAKKLACSSVLLVNVEANHETLLDYNWMYVYDESKYSTRINCTEKLTPGNAPKGTTGVQVEVYFSMYRPMMETAESIAHKVCEELIEMGLIKSKESISGYHTQWVPWANVIFDHHRKASLDIVLTWLSKHGLERNNQDLKPMTDWNSPIDNKTKGMLHLAGRFAEWKYFWTDDCVLRGKQLAEIINIS